MNKNCKPISRHIVEKQAKEVNGAMEQKLLQQLIENVNEGINNSVMQNLTFYSTYVPTVVFGYPSFNAEELTNMLAQKYKESGFETSTRNNFIVIKWEN
jgi:Cdc6-like AAA superfamily ATPase